MAGGCRWTRPLMGGTCPNTFNSASGIAAAGMAQILGKNDLNIVYVASCSVWKKKKNKKKQKKETSREC